MCVFVYLCIEHRDTGRLRGLNSCRGWAPQLPRVAAVLRFFNSCTSEHVPSKQDIQTGIVENKHESRT